MNLEQVFSPWDNTTEHTLRFEPPIEDFTRYHEPSALPVGGIVVDRVKTAVNIPRLNVTIRNNFKTRTESIKVRIREWELSMMKHLEHTVGNDPHFKIQLRGTTSGISWRATLQRPTNLKASLIVYLIDSWYNISGPFHYSDRKSQEFWN